MDRPSTSSEIQQNAEPNIEIVVMSAQASTSSEIEVISTQASEVNADSSQQGAAEEEECVSGMELSVYNAATTGDTDSLSLYGQGLSEKLTATGNTVLHIYIACVLPDNADKVRTVDLILELCPALLSQANKNGETALHIASRHGHDDIVQLLIDAAKAPHREEGSWSMLIRTTNTEMDTALHEAVRFNHLDVVETLTREDPLFSYSANAAGETPLYMAVERGHLHLVTEILEACSNAAFQGPNGRTALHAAVSYNDIEMTRKLLTSYTHERALALTKAVDEQGMTPLHLAAWFGYTSIVKQLLESDKSAAYIRDKNDRKTALHIAAFRGHLEIFKELISQCPDCCELVDKSHRSVLHYAVMRKQYHIQDFIRQDGWLSTVLLNGKDADSNTPLQHLLTVSVHEVHKRSGECMSVMKSCNDLIHDAKVDKMSFNKRNRNATDIIPTGNAVSAWEKDLRRELEVNGGRPSRRIVMDLDNNEQVTEIKGAVKHTSGEEYMGEKQAHLIVATLIATVSFTAAMNVPGGYESEGPGRGLAVLRGDVHFRLYVGFNAISLLLSASSVGLNFFLVDRVGPQMLRRVKDLTFFALVFMLAAFVAGLGTTLSTSSQMIGPLLIPVCLISVTLAYTQQNIQRFFHLWFPGCPASLIYMLVLPIRIFSNRWGLSSTRDTDIPSKFKNSTEEVKMHSLTAHMLHIG